MQEVETTGQCGGMASGHQKWPKQPPPFELRHIV